MANALNSRMLLATIIVGAAALASAQAAEMTTKANRERCYGIAKAGQNSCAAANGKHSCATDAKASYSGQDFREVAKGTCEAMNGSLQPFDGVNPKIKDPKIKE